MNLTGEQLTRVRTRPHSSRLWLSIFRPQTVLSAQIDQSDIAKAAREITISVIEGIPANVLSGMTVYIGTTQGGNDLGRLRVRSATSTTITVAENSIHWIDGWYLTVVRYFEPWGVFPRITLDDDNVPSFFKDYDVAYTDQNQLLDPVVCMGPDHAIMLDPTPSGSYATIWYTSSGSFDPTPPTGDISSYDWHFEGGSPTGSTESDPGYVDYTGCGHYLTSLTLTSNAGKSFTGRRHISILARPERDEDGDCKPLSVWGFRALSGSRDSGGYTMDAWVRQSVSLADLPDGALVVVFSEDDREGYVEGKIGANAENRGTILFTGYIDGESVAWNPTENQVEFKVLGIAARMDRLSTFSAALDDKETANTWNEMRQMTIDRGIIHFLRWHTTVLAVKDFSQTGDEKRVQYLDFSRGSVFSGVDGLLESAVFGTLVADRQGKLWAEIDKRVVTTGSSRQTNDTMQSVLSVSRQDWRNRVTVRRMPHTNVSFLELGGIAYSGEETGTFDAYLSGAPGDAPDYFGGTERRTGLVIIGQDQLNELTGHAWATRNADFPEIMLPMAGDYRFIDIAPQHRILMNLPAEDNHRAIELVDAPFIPTDVDYRWSPQDQSLLMDLKITEETHGLPGDSIEIPVDPPYSSPVFDFPPIVVPPIPLPSEIPPEFDSTGRLVYVVTASVLARSRNFGENEDATWEDITPSATSVTGSYRVFHLDPIDPTNTAYLVTLTGGGTPPNGPFVYRTTNLNAPTPAWTQLLSPQQWRDIFSNMGNTGGENRIDGLSVSRVSNNVIYLLGSGRGIAIANDRTFAARSSDNGVTWEDVTDANMDGEMGNRDRAVRIFASEHAVQRAWAMRSRIGAGQANVGIIVTDNFGSTWTDERDASGQEVTEIHVPFNGNGGDQTTYWGEVFAAGKTVYRTTDGFNNATDITPVFQGDTYGVRRSGDSRDSYWNIRTWFGNRLFTAAILVEADGEASSVYFTSTDGADTWVPRVVFDGWVTHLWWNPGNVDQLYMIGRTGGEQAIYFTEDGGLSWIDLAPSWQSFFGGAPNPFQTTGIPFTIQNVWAE